MPFIQLEAKKGFGVEVEFDIHSSLFESRRKDFEFITNHNVKHSRTNDCFFLKPDRAVCGGYIGEIMELNAGIYPLTVKGIDLFIEHLAQTYRDLSRITPNLFDSTC